MTTRRKTMFGRRAFARVTLATLVMLVAAGAQAGPRRIADLCEGSQSSEPIRITEWAGRLYFGAADDCATYRLWVSEGTAAATHRVSDVALGSHEDYVELMPFDGKLYFVAEDDMAGRELWATDGTTTALVMDINPGTGSSNPHLGAVHDGKLFFSADDGVHGAELWAIDGLDTALTKPHRAQAPVPW